MAIQSVLEAYGDNIVGSGISLPNSFILRNQTLTFSNLVATVTDSRITTTTLLLTYYSDDSVASSAGVKASVTAAGTITFTATSAPSSTLSVDIVCIVEGLSVQPDVGGGHEIENSAGTKLTQRDVMQVLDGLEAVDDSTNQKTKIKMNLPIMSSADWNAMTEQEKAAYKASHYRFGVEVPDTEGVINAEYMKLLWENPNTTQAFPAQTITLNSADYNFLLVCYAYAPSIQNFLSVIAPKGKNIYLTSATAQSTGAAALDRAITYVNDTTLSVDNGYTSIGGGAKSTNNSSNIPVAIYGIKKNFQFKVNAIATDLSTRADHCFLSDDETTVEDKFEELQANNGGTQVNIKSYTSSNPFIAPSDGYVELNTANGSGESGIVRILGANGNLITISSASHPNILSTYVRKGMKVYTQSATTNMVISFTPVV